MSRLLSSPLVKPFLNIDSYKEIELPFDYKEEKESQIIKDLIHLEYLNFQQIKPLLIDKLSQSINLPKDQLIHVPQGLSPRKTYEVEKFASYILSLHETVPFEFIIDIGAGKSYLGRALCSKFPIVSIENDPIRTKTSKRIGSLLLNGTKNDSIHYTTGIEFGADTLRFINSHKKVNNETPKAIVIGLDICGDTLPNMAMDALVNGIKGLEVIGTCFVGCCFHKIQDGFRSSTLRDHSPRFDKLMSSHDLRYLDHNDLILEFKREYFKEKFQERTGMSLNITILKNTDYENWEKFNTRIGEIYGNEQVRSKIEQVTKNEFISDFKKWCYVKGFISIVMESIIHEDRLMYLEENGCMDCSIEVLFNFTKSSRNVLIKGIKNSYIHH